MGTLIGNDLYTHLADIFEYPWTDIKGKVEEALNILEKNPVYPSEVKESLQAFKEAIGSLSLDELQEVYSYTFEMSSDLTLDLGHHILDGFKRSGTLLQIKTMYKEHGFPFETYDRGELPDYLPLVLRFLDFVKDGEVKKRFRKEFLIKSLEKLYKNFSKNEGNPYKHLVDAVYRVIDFDVKKEEGR